ncbi:hypothetical protein HQ531_14320 [bacterium]|nr:hypothetical protein [bacterium]
MKFIKFSLALGFFIFWGCNSEYPSSPTNTIIFEDANSVGDQEHGLNKPSLPNMAQEYSINDSNIVCVPCANNFYADRFFTATTTFSYAECSGYGDVMIDGEETAYLWAEYNPSWDEDLGFQACGESTPASLPAIDNFEKELGIYPTMKWDFMWAHYWVIERRIGTGSYSQVYSYTVPPEPIQSTPDTNWVDTSIRLNRFDDIVYYRIKGKIWSELSSSGPVIYWDNRENPD